MAGLYEHPALSLAPPGPAGDLGNQLRHVFLGPEVETIEAVISINDYDEPDLWEVVALGKHLCPDKDFFLHGSH